MGKTELRVSLGITLLALAALIGSALSGEKAKSKSLRSPGSEAPKMEIIHGDDAQVNTGYTD